MSGDVVAAIMAGRLEFGALMGRPARMSDPADEAAVLAEAFPAYLACGCAEGACDCAPVAAEVAPAQRPAVQTVCSNQRLPASWTAAAQAVQLPAGQPSRRRRSTQARRQPLAPVAPITAQDGF